MRLKFELVGATFAIFIVGPIVWMTLDQSPPLSVVGVDQDRPTIDRGGSLHPKYEAVWYRRCSGKSQRKFIDYAHVPLESEAYDFRDGIALDGRPIELGVLKQTPPVVATIPIGMAPGPARMQTTSRFYCNPLQKMLGPQWSLFSIEFRYPIVDFTVGASIASKTEPPTTIFAPVQKDEGLAPPLDEGSLK